MNILTEELILLGSIFSTITAGTIKIYKKYEYASIN